jgi:hypothetical protein
MLTIRREQIDAFRRPAILDFENRMIEHIAKFFPKLFAELGEEKMRLTIQYGIKRAESYGIVAERDVCKYVNLMVACGRDFDRDPALPWARRVLNDPRVEAPSDRTEHLVNAALENLPN